MTDTQSQPTTTDATRCKMCGGPFAAKRIIIEGEQYHEACAIMSYPPHTHEDYARLSDSHASLKARIEALEKALQLAEDVLSRVPYSTEIWPNGMHPQKGITIIREALALNSQHSDGEA